MGNDIFLIKSVIWLVYDINLKEKVYLSFCWIWKFNVPLKIKILRRKMCLSVFRDKLERRGYVN